MATTNSAASQHQISRAFTIIGCIALAIGVIALAYAAAVIGSTNEAIAKKQNSNPLVAQNRALRQAGKDFQFYVDTSVFDGQRRAVLEENVPFLKMGGVACGVGVVALIVGYALSYRTRRAAPTHEDVAPPTEK